MQHSFIESIKDYIIVGQGLAGSALAMRLMARGQRVIVIDEPSKNKCSRVAAGLFNPITGMGIVKTWLAKELFSSLRTFYSQCEKQFGQRFLFHSLLYRPFHSVEEQNNWMVKSHDHGIDSFVEKIYTHSHFENEVNDHYGGILLNTCGYLDTRLFLDAARNFLESRGAFRDEHFDYAKLEVSSSRVLYDGISARKIIFCQGAETNLFFDWLPIRPLKGETAAVKIDFKPSVIYNKGVYLVPLNGTNLYKVGATYNLQDMTHSVTSAGQQELNDKLRDLIRGAFEVVGQDWGIRPTTVDRRPILGAHPMYKNLVIFNGLGTKGVSLAPYFAAHLADWLEGEGDLAKEVNIERFHALYSKSKA